LRAATGSALVTDEATILEDIATVFKGQYRGLLILAWLKAFVFVGIMLWCAWQFFQQDTVMGMIAYASGTIISVMTIAMIYTIFYLFLTKNMTVREIKRLELQVALLAGRLDAGKRSEAA
ncbi:MAG: hypothetical protein KDI19_16380, partial [Pseudomonadales bacterium]|nr:hypothetical protein [Pseudomonadales bacterium]